ncbi:MAG TPA: hypothetical protein VN840_20095 [Streptosporangiaceae bacterium]|nr:hypothetical protein [Streptosporangiaceae bacterium]
MDPLLVLGVIVSVGNENPCWRLYRRLGLVRTSSTGRTGLTSRIGTRRIRHPAPPPSNAKQ